MDTKTYIVTYIVISRQAWLILPISLATLLDHFINSADKLEKEELVRETEMRNRERRMQAREYAYTHTYIHAFERMHTIMHACIHA